MTTSKRKKVILAVAAVMLSVCLVVMAIGCTNNNDLNAVDGTDGRVSSSADNVSDSGNAVHNSYTVQTNFGTPSSSATDYTQMVNDVVDSVVLIYILQSGSSTYQSAGSGVFYGEIEGEDASMIVTCTHVIDDAQAVRVYVNTGDTDSSNDIALDAEIIGMDDISDVAVLKVDGTGYDYATLRNTDEAPILLGEEVTAIGNALGAGISVTKGIISGTSRTISMDGISMTLLQIDAAVNGGNSGGALFDSEGYLVGIVNAKSTGDDVEGIGYAIPVYDVTDKADGLISTSGDPAYNGLGYIEGEKRLGITVSQLNGTQITGRFSGITSTPADGEYYYYVSPSYEISAYGSVARSGATSVFSGSYGALITGATVDGTYKAFTDEYLLDDMINETAIGDTVTLHVITISAVSGGFGGLFISYNYTATTADITMYQYVCGFTG